MTETIESTDIITIPHKNDVPALFSKKGGIAALVSQIEKEARAVVVDASTPVGRKDARSLAAKVSRSKTLIDEVGKEQNEERNRLNKEVNALRNLAKDRLDALRDEIRAPVEAWEQKELDRVRHHEQRMDLFNPERVNNQFNAGTIQSIIDEVDACQIDDTWEEYEADARTAKAAALEKYRMDLATAQAREDQEAELLKLRADAEARAKADQERETQEAAAKAEQERKDAEAKALAEAETRAKEAAAKELADAKEAHAKQLAESKAREEAAAQAERDRIAAKEKAEADAAAKRAADKKHRQKIRQEAIEAIEAIKPESINEIIDAIIAGEVPHVTVTF